MRAMYRVLLIAVLIVAVGILNQPVLSQSFVFQENFEDYTLNTWPSTWLKDANARSDPANNKTVVDPLDSSNTALQLYGVPNGNWAAIAYHDYTYSDHLNYSFSLYSGSGDTYGNQPGRGGVAIKNGPAWHYSTPGVTLLSTNLVDNCFYGIGGKNLGSFEEETWYDVTVGYDRDGTDFSASYWIDGYYLGRDTATTTFTAETTFDYLQLHSGDRAALFDDILISERSVYDPSNTGNVYGVFVGVEHMIQKDGVTSTLRGDDNAKNLYNIIASNIPNFKEGTLLTANLSAGEKISKESVHDAIDSLYAKMTPGDTLIFYSASHGGYVEGVGDEDGTLTVEDEGVVYGEWEEDGKVVHEWLFDDDLKTYLAGKDDISKWVLLGSCHSGGFWGNYKPGDVGDLEELSNISLLAAAREGLEGEQGTTTGYDGYDTGLMYFGSALEEAFGLDDNGYLIAANGDYTLTFDELTSWVQGYGNRLDGAVWFEADFGNPTLFTSDMWSPVGMMSPDFSDGLYVGPQSTVPAPSAILLTGLGCGLIGCMRRRRTL